LRLISDDVFGKTTCWQEARGESHKGKVMVCEVIRTRTSLKLYSDGTVAGTVLFPFQFSGWNADDPNWRPSLVLDDSDPVVADCALAWSESETTNYSKGATHYVNLAHGRPSWANSMQLVAVEDHHTFFKEQRHG
jgi:hypothetical protein